MSNKARSRKRRHKWKNVSETFYKISEVVDATVDFLMMLGVQKFESKWKENHLPKSPISKLPKPKHIY